MAQPAALMAVHGCLSSRQRILGKLRVASGIPTHPGMWQKSQLLACLAVVSVGLRA